MNEQGKDPQELNEPKIVNPGGQQTTPELEQPVQNIQNPQPQVHQKVISQDAKIPNARSAIKNPFSSNNNNLGETVFRYGLALLLITNGIYAFAEPDSFKTMLEENFITGKLPDPIINILIAFTGVNDLVLAVLVMMNIWRKQVYLWIGVWFGIIAFIKLTNLIF